MVVLILIYNRLLTFLPLFVTLSVFWIPTSLFATLQLPIFIFASYRTILNCPFQYVYVKLAAYWLRFCEAIYPFQLSVYVINSFQTVPLLLVAHWITSVYVCRLSPLMSCSAILIYWFAGTYYLPLSVFHLAVGSQASFFSHPLHVSYIYSRCPTLSLVS